MLGDDENRPGSVDERDGAADPVDRGVGLSLRQMRDRHDRGSGLLGERLERREDRARRGVAVSVDVMVDVRGDRIDDDERCAHPTHLVLEAIRPGRERRESGVAVALDLDEVDPVEVRAGGEETREENRGPFVFRRRYGDVVRDAGQIARGLSPSDARREVAGDRGFSFPAATAERREHPERDPTAADPIYPLAESLEPQ